MQTATTTKRSGWLTGDKLAVSVGLGLLVTIIGRIVGMGRGVVMAHTLDPAELGAFSLGFNAVNLLGLVLVLGLPSGIARYADREHRQGRLRSFLIWTGGWTLAATAATCGLCFLFLGNLSTLVFQEDNRETLMALVLVAVLFTAAFNIMQGVLQGLRLTRLLSTLQTAQSIAFAFFVVIFPFTWRSDALSAIVAMGVSAVFVLLLVFAVIYRQIPQVAPTAAAEPTVSKGTLVWYSLGTWITGAVCEGTRLVDRWMFMHDSSIDATTGLEMAGSYHLVESVTGPMLSMSVMVAIFALPHITHLWENDQRDESKNLVQKMAKLTVAVLVAVSIGLIFVKPVILGIVFKDTAGYGSDIFELSLVAMIFMASNYLVRSYLLCRERARDVAIASLIGLAVAIGANWYLIPQYHLVGAAIAALLSGWCSTAWLLASSWLHGLRAHRSFYTMLLLLPLVLILPAKFLALAILPLVALGATTEVLFDAAEKQWLREQFAKLVARVRRQASAEPAAASLDDSQGQPALTVS